MAGLPPTQQAPQQGSQPNPNQPTATQNPYGNSGSNYQQPTYVDPSQFSPNATIQQIMAGFAPQAQSSENNLNQTLADFGINGGQAVGAMSQLQSQLAGALGPTLANAIQGSQGMQLGAGEFNANAYNNQQSSIFNAINSMIGGGQGAGNQNANQYGSTVTQTPSIWSTITQGLGTAGQAAGAAEGFSGGGSTPGSNPYASPY
jgi:hypothetical protein